MLVDRDPAVLARINLHAVLGALPVLARLSPAGAEILAGLTKPIAVTFRVPGLEPASYTFSADGIVARRLKGAARVTLAFTSPAHFNSLIDGTGTPIPLGGPRGLAFLTGPFGALADLLGRYLKPSDEDLADAEFGRVSTILTLHVAGAAVAQVANHDRQGRFSAHHMPDGQVAILVGDDIDLRLTVAGHQVTFDPSGPESRPDAELAFADLEIAGGVLTGQASALACLGNGTLAMRGFIPLVDNTNRLLDRVGTYLGD